MLCPVTRRPCRESTFRVGGSTICLDCQQKIATCCEGGFLPEVLSPADEAARTQASVTATRERSLRALRSP